MVAGGWRLVVCLGAAVSLAAVPARAQPSAPVGRVKVSSGSASIVRGGQMMTAPVGTEVYESDTVHTGADGRLAVMLRDETGCARARVEPPGVREMVALAPDPESGDVGALTVGTANGGVALTRPYQATTLAAGATPTPPAVLPPDEMQRLFGEALAALPPPARRFLLYFDTGSDTLTAQSRALVPEILRTVQGRPVPEVGIVGHTDTTGRAAANVELGLRRAALMRDLLVAAGLDVGLVEVASHGETNPVVRTPDNTTEARNRRVEVTVR